MLCSLPTEHLEWEMSVMQAKVSSSLVLMKLNHELRGLVCLIMKG